MKISFFKSDTSIFLAGIIEPGAAEGETKNFNPQVLRLELASVKICHENNYHSQVSWSSEVGQDRLHLYQLSFGLRRRDASSMIIHGTWVGAQLQTWSLETWLPATSSAATSTKMGSGTTW